MKCEAGAISETSCRFHIRDKKVTISFRGREFSVYNSVGMGYIMELVKHPGIPVGFLQIDCIQPQRLAGYRHLETKDTQLEHGIREQDKSLVYAMTDRKTLASIKQRLNRIIAELAEVTEANDYARADDLRDEQDALMHYLRVVYRPEGRVRSFKDADSRQKDKVLKAIRRAISDIEEHDPELALYISTSLELNEYMVYHACQQDLDICIV